MPRTVQVRSLSSAKCHPLSALVSGWRIYDMQLEDMNGVVYQLLLVELFAAAAAGEPAIFSWDALVGALPALQPLVDAGSKRCEALKNIFGITYDQMQSRNTNPHNNIDVVHIRRSGSIKYNMTSRLSKYLTNAENLYILLHGFLESSDGQMIQTVAPELLKQKDTTVLALDGRNVFSMEYFTSSTYVRFIGEKLGDILSEMILSGQDPARITLIGHSLGAHIAGIAGKQMARAGHTLGRITALDPAGPCFTSADPSARLDSTDAQYVDVIHTNALFGIREPIGHKDFYPNGGVRQPGCYLSTCDHTRAWQLYAEAVSAPDHFPARRCINWTMFTEGQCIKNEVAFLGPDSKNGLSGSYYLTTRGQAPYGLGPAGSGK